MKIPKLGLQSMLRKFSALRNRVLGRLNAQFIIVPINQCRHYCAFRYGCKSFNPYENYIIGLHEGISLVEIRKRFDDFLMYFRPRSFGEVFGIEMSRHVPLWVYPWSHGQFIDTNAGWRDILAEVPDIITHFCEQGIQRSRIEEEYFWLEQAYTSISKYGYQPNSYSFIEAFELKKGNENVYVLTDGNHRISALSALGHKHVLIKVSRSIKWNGKNHQKWNQVRLGTYSEQDAIQLFNVYFTGVNNFKRSNQPAKIIEDQVL
jgi:hypothetical protein